MIPGQWTRTDILALTLLSGIRGQRIRQIVEEYPSAPAFLDTAPDGKWFRSETLFGAQQWEEARAKAEQQQERADRFGAQIVTFWDDGYPALLREIYYPPVVLYVWGSLQPADSVAVAIVGTRRATQYGRLVAEHFVETLARAGLIIVSGLAYGIDSVAHRATLQVGGVTYAVIAAGLDKLSPSTAVKLAQQIVDKGGAVITEYPFGIKAIPSYFPMRNRIISGIAHTVLVVESGEKGGALITARFALDQNRELFAVPGNITSEKSKGCNLLIQRSQAMPALSPDDILRTFGVEPKPEQKLTVSLTPEEEQLYAALSMEPQHIDEIAEQLGMPVNQVMVLLLQLEFKGVARQLPGKLFVRG